MWMDRSLVVPCHDLGDPNEKVGWRSASPTKILDLGVKDPPPFLHVLWVSRPESRRPWPSLLNDMEFFPMAWFFSRQSNPNRQTSGLSLEGLEARAMMAADVQPVLMVIANQDFYYQEYAETRQSLEAAGLEVVVAAATTETATPHLNSGQGSGSGHVLPDLALSDANAEDYSAIVFVGGWGSSQYQYAFEGTYQNTAYNGSAELRETVNTLVGDFVAEGKHVAAICHGVTVLAWARVDGVSPLDGREVSVPYVGSPPVELDGQWYSYNEFSQYDQATMNGADANEVSGQYGDPMTVADDVIVDGKIITAENYDAALEFGRVLAQELIAAAESETPPTEDPPASEDPVVIDVPPPVIAPPSDETPPTTEDPTPVEEPAASSAKPVLMVIANQDFYYREYSETRASLEAAGLEVVVAAATTDTALPHANTGQGDSSGQVTPDLALSSVEASDYSAIVFVGGWGSSQYQYAFEGTYQHGQYNGTSATKAIVNDLINDFVEQDKHVAAICHGVTVLAWARVDGVSPLEGRQVSIPYIGSPAVEIDGQWYGNYELGQYEQIVENGGDANLVSGQYGDPATAADDVIVDGKIITAENYDSAAYFGQVIAEQVIAATAESDTPVVDEEPTVDEEPVVEDEPAVDEEPVVEEEPTTDPEPPAPASRFSIAGLDFVVRGTDGNDTIYLWSGAADNEVYAWVNGEQSGRVVLPEGGRLIVYAGDGNDQVYATDVRTSVSLFGEGGHDILTGGTANDILVGGDGYDRVSGHEGNDLIIGGSGVDWLHGGSGNDVIIGGSTTFDTSAADLASLSSTWSSTADLTLRASELAGSLIFGQSILDDGQADILHGEDDRDLFFAQYGEACLDADETDLVVGL